MNFKKGFWFIKTQLFRFKYGSVGKNSYVGNVLFIQRKKNVYIGDNVHIYPNMRVELTPKNARLIIEENVSIGQGFHAVSYEEDLVIGKNTTISGNVFISNVDHDYHDIGKHILKQSMIKRKTKIGENCFIGYGAVILPGTVLGKQCIVGANAVVKGHYDDYCVIAGNPAKVVKKYDADSGEWNKN